MERLTAQRGYGLPATILMIVVFALLGLVGLALARQELRTQTRATSREVAFYAAQAGLAKGLENWRTPAGVVPPGTTWSLDEGTLPGGASYRVEAVRLDFGAVAPLYAIRSQGVSRDGRSQQVGLLITTLPLDGLFEAALSVADSARLKGTTDVVGFDRVPGTWLGSYCSATDDDKAGMIMADTTLFERKGAAKLMGDPRLLQDDDTTGFFNLGDMTFDQLAAAADIELPAGAVVDSLGPSYNGDGTCNTSDPRNWGDPENPGGRCSDWFPIIHAKGDLSLSGNMAGQGILLVDGDLQATGGTRFYGPVIVKGRLVAAGNFEFYGGVRARTSDMSVGTSAIYYSHCVLQRAMSHTRVSKPRPLTGRPWFQKR
jgi:hypothetical protein